MDPALLEELRAHDAEVARRGLPIWIGAEPTFTDRSSLDPPWLFLAAGGDKEARARRLLEALAPRLPGPVRLRRVRGRRYPGEEAPRFCLGVRFPRQGPPSHAPPEAVQLDEEGTAPEPGGDAWLTVTPDPGVVEVNTDPLPDLCAFAARIEALYAAAAEAGLSPVRWRYNGDRTDSGGGGQLTLGGPAPERSPFFARPQLLPRLVRYLNRHPALSYAFAPECVGSAGQGPRPDEGARERFEELPVALEALASHGERVSPEELFAALGPLLVDGAGNPHRAELNVEKLWNPAHDRGQLGVVELRALRMPPTPARLAAVAWLFRAVAARLASAPYEEPLLDWGAQLHERHGLPWFLRRDLEAVLEDLAVHGLGAGPALQAELLRPPEPVATVALPGGGTLELTPALAFWPLLGDVASQEGRGARLVDASSARVQLLLTPPEGGVPGRLAAGGWRVPLHPVPGGGARRLGSVLYRSFTPRPGLHPGLGPDDPLVLDWERGPDRLRVALHGWAPGGGAYDGLPGDEAEAARRRAARVVVSPGLPLEPRQGRASGWVLDLRRPATALLQPSASPHPAVP
ncbi:MAG: transglutaminase family protein [Anaeromyxobacter sp.]